jgi:hypothetical protein
MSPASTGEVFDLGLANRVVDVPDGWTVVRVEGDQPEDTLAAGVREEEPVGGFSSSVLFFMGDHGIEVPASEFEPGQVLHDSTGQGPLRRLVVRFNEIIDTPVTTVHAWIEVQDQPLLVMATVRSDRIASVWPVVRRVLASVLPGELDALGRWLG